MRRIKDNKKSRRSVNAREDETINQIDQLHEFEEFREKILPALRDAILKGETPEVLRKRHLSHVQARQIMDALFHENPTVRAGAIKDILDRQEGKPKEHKAVEHRLGRLSDTELDAILVSSIDETPDEAL